MFHIPVYLQLLVATAEKVIFIPTILHKTDGKFNLPPTQGQKMVCFVLREVTSFIKGGMGVFGVQRKSCLIALG